MAGAAPLVAYAQVFLSEEQAVKVLFSNQAFTKKSFVLGAEEARAIAEKSGQPVRTHTLNIWLSAHKDIVFVDEVLGKHEFITYAVAVGRDGHVRGVEILQYREAYGQQIAGQAWRKQFVGATSASTLKINQDIKNISGATLSSTHVTAGVKRILQTYEQIRGRI